MIYYISLRRTNDHHAGAKAPNDIYALCEQRGWTALHYPCPKKHRSLQLFRLRRGLMVWLFWCSALVRLKPGDIVFYQHPVRYGSKIASAFVRRIQKRNVSFIALIHDLDSLRYGMIYSPAAHTNVCYEDEVFLKQFDVIICHNGKMKKYLTEKGFSEDRLICLNLFDYLFKLPGTDAPEGSEGVVIAGNLDEKKSGYIYQLSHLDLGCPVHLYGVNYSDHAYMENALIYHGSFAPDRLPQVLEGRFGLVWDGSSPDTCNGPGGNYLRYNNPHKLSLYLAAGLPVITWREAAVASFVEESGIGITVASLREIPGRLHRITEEQYAEMKTAVKAVREKVVRGDYFNQAMEEALKRF